MTTFQLLLLIVTAGIFYLFFKQLFSGTFPKRGIDFEAKVSDEQIGGITQANKTFSTPKHELDRMKQLLNMADEAIEKKDFDEAKKALGSALIREDDNIDALQKMGFVAMQTKDYTEAKESYAKLVALDENDDMAHALLANSLHKLGDDKNAIEHHKKSIVLDSMYAPHHFNYANTLYDLGNNKEALASYKKSYELDDSLEVAKDMIERLEKEK